ncbi:MAG: alpha/beta hydrolase [Anaerolineae bacterium]|nr:alpha/beta hydrolase [Anaerolineae bacterium]
MPPVLVDVLVALIVLIAIILIAAWLLAGRATRRWKPDPPCTPDEYQLPFEHVTFTARDGVRLGGRLTGEQGRRPVVIFCAGLFGSMDGDTALLPVFYKAGFDVLQFDWRGHGISDGQRVTLGVDESQDLIGAMDFLQARGVKRIGLLGFSLGGGIALRVAAEDKRVVCVVADGANRHLFHVIQGAFRDKVGLPLKPLAGLVVRFIELRLGGISLDDASPLGEVGEISPRPVLFIHGGSDPFVPLADQQALFDACGDPKDLWRVEGAGHREAEKIEPEAYRERVIGFFKAKL